MSFPNGSLGGDSEQSQSCPALSSWTQGIYLFHSPSHSRDYICLSPHNPLSKGSWGAGLFSLLSAPFIIHSARDTARGKNRGEKCFLTTTNIMPPTNINSPGFKPDTGTMGQNVKLGPSQDTCGDSLVAQSVKRIYLQCRRPGFNSCMGKIPWRRKWQPTPVFLPRESQGQRSLAGYSPWGRTSRTRLSN